MFQECSSQVWRTMETLAKDKYWPPKVWLCDWLFLTASNWAPFTRLSSAYLPGHHLGRYFIDCSAITCTYYTAVDNLVYTVAAKYMCPKQSSQDPASPGVVENFVACIKASSLKRNFDPMSSLTREQRKILHSPRVIKKKGTHISNQAPTDSKIDSSTIATTTPLLPA
jgi:hypothetical protein